MEADTLVFGLPSRLWLFIAVMVVMTKVFYYAVVTMPRLMEQHRKYVPVAERLNNTYRASMVFNMTDFNVVMRVLDQSGLMTNTVNLMIRADEDRIGPHRLAAILNQAGVDKRYQWLGFKGGVTLKATIGWELSFHYPTDQPIFQNET